MAAGDVNIPSSADVSAADRATQLVDGLYEFRDHYFERNSLERAIHKTEDVGEELKKVMASLEELQGDVDDKAYYLMLQGKALNVMPNYDEKALEYLSKAVKLNPNLGEAWTHLGESYWKKQDIKAARNCFTSALSHGKNKVLLRNLSMVMRQFETVDTEEKVKVIEESVEKAKEAVGLDIKDGTSWFILGNGYLSLFFAGSQLPTVLKQCMSAYNQAEKDIVASCNPDLHYNRSIMYKYQESYQLALIGFSRASVLDPTWPEPIEKRKLLVNYLEKVQDLIHSKGKLRSKKVLTLVNAISESGLGPYAGGSYTSKTNKKTIKLELSPLAVLEEGVNLEKVVQGKVVCAVTTDEPVPFTFCLIDKDQTVFSVTLYNVSPSFSVKTGDAVAIAEPFQQLVDVEYEDKRFCYKSIRVDSPVVMVVNGRKLGLDKQAPSILGLSVKSD